MNIELLDNVHSSLTGKSTKVYNSGSDVDITAPTYI